MTIGSNEARYYGAAIMMYSEKFRELSEALSSDLWIIPSSIHEIIAVPMQEVPKEYIQMMIREVNRTQLAPDEVLTDTLYVYEHNTGEVRVAA